MQGGRQVGPAPSICDHTALDWCWSSSNSDLIIDLCRTPAVGGVSPGVGFEGEDQDNGSDLWDPRAVTIGPDAVAAAFYGDASGNKSVSHEEAANDSEKDFGPSRLFIDVPTPTVPWAGTEVLVTTREGTSLEAPPATTFVPISPLGSIPVSAAPDRLWPNPKSWASGNRGQDCGRQCRRGS